MPRVIAEPALTSAPSSSPTHRRLDRSHSPNTPSSSVTRSVGSPSSSALRTDTPGTAASTPSPSCATPDRTLWNANDLFPPGYQPSLTSPPRPTMASSPPSTPAGRSSLEELPEPVTDRPPTTCQSSATRTKPRPRSSRGEGPAEKSLPCMLPHGIPLDRAMLLVQRFLSLDEPRITSKFVDYLEIDGAMEVFINFIARSKIPAELTLIHPTDRGYTLPELVARFRHWPRDMVNIEAVKQSYAAVQAFTDLHNSHSNHIALLKLDVTICALFGVFDPGSNGNLYHFHKLMGYFLDNFAERTLQCLLTVAATAPNAAPGSLDHAAPRSSQHSGATCETEDTSAAVFAFSSALSSPALGPVADARSEAPLVDGRISHFLASGRKPLIFAALPFLSSPPILDFVMHVVVRLSTPDVYQERFEHLRDLGFTDLLFYMIDDQWQPCIFEGATDLITTLIDGRYNTHRLDLLFSHWEQHEPGVRPFTSKLVNHIVRASNDRLARCSITILATLLKRTACRYGRWVRQQQNCRSVEPLFGPTNSLVTLGQTVREQLQPHLPSLCQALVARHPDGVQTRRAPLDFRDLQLIQLIYHVLVEADNLPAILRTMPQSYWAVLTALYFTHAANSLLQTVMYKYIALLVQHAQYLHASEPASPLLSGVDKGSDSEWDTVTTHPLNGVDTASGSWASPRVGKPTSRPGRRAPLHKGASRPAFPGPSSLPAALNRKLMLAVSPSLDNLGTPPLSTASAIPSPRSPYPVGFSSDNDVLVYLIHECQLVERLVQVCQDSKPSNALRGTSLLILNTFRLGIEAIYQEVGQLSQLASSNASEAVSVASSLGSRRPSVAPDDLLTAETLSSPMSPAPNGAPSVASLHNGSANDAAPLNSSSAQPRAIPMPTRPATAPMVGSITTTPMDGPMSGAGSLTSDSAGLGSGSWHHLSNSLLRPYSQHWSSYLKELPEWYEYLPELQRQAQRQVEHWAATFHIVNYNRDSFSCQPPLPFLSPLRVRMPEEYANNYLNRQGVANTQEGMLGTQGPEMPLEPIRGVMLDDKGIDLGSLFAFSLGFGISPGAAGLRDGSNKPGSRAIRRKGPSSRRKRTKNPKPVVGRRAPSPITPTATTSPPAEGAALSTIPEASAPAPPPLSPELPSSTVVVDAYEDQALGPNTHSQNTQLDSFKAPRPLVNANPVEAPHEDNLGQGPRHLSCIKQQFYETANVPDQSKVPLYPPVLVRQPELSPPDSPGALTRSGVDTHQTTVATSLPNSIP